MTSKGYTTSALVADELGRVLTAPQLVQCDTLIEQAEAWIDHETGGAWLAEPTVTDELHHLTSSVVYLDNWPVAAITSIVVRPQYVGAPETVLTEGTDYELVDAGHGLLLVRGFGTGWLLKASYTTSSVALPGDLARAATMLVAHWMLPRLDDVNRNGIESYSVGADLSVKFRTDGESIPDDVVGLVGHHKVSVSIA